MMHLPSLLLPFFLWSSIRRAAAADEDSKFSDLDMTDLASSHSDSIQLDLADLLKLDLELPSKLGVESWDAYNAVANVTVDADTCDYTLTFDMFAPSDLPVGVDSFQGVCDPTSTGTAPNGQPYHKQTQYWSRLPKYMQDATGIDHIAIQWKPCGDNPGPALQQPRWDVVYYFVPPEYRAIMQCTAAAATSTTTGTTCEFGQESGAGRAFFSVPTLQGSTQIVRIPNMPINFFPTTAVPYEGLVAYAPDEIPPDAFSWLKPSHHMSSYDGDVISWRMIIPYKYFSQAGGKARFMEQHSYVGQSKKRLLTKWESDFNFDDDLKIRMRLSGKSGLCHDEFAAAVAKAKEGVATSDSAR